MRIIIAKVLLSLFMIFAALIVGVVAYSALQVGSYIPLTVLLVVALFFGLSAIGFLFSSEKDFYKS